MGNNQIENVVKKTVREKLVDEVVPQFEKFSESRESYIQALEKTIEVVMGENQTLSHNHNDIRSSIDELVAMQRLSNTIGIAVEPNTIVNTLTELTEQVIPVIEASIFLFDMTARRLLPLTAHGSVALENEAQQHIESGVVDWLFSEMKTVIIPDLSHLMTNGSTRNYVLVPLMLRGNGIGIYMIHTEKKQEEFSHQDIQLLTVLANQAAIGVENWRTHTQLAKANNELKSFQAQMLQAAKLAAVGELAASIVHEIKNPVQILMMQMEIVNSGRAKGDWLGMLSTQIKRLSEITRRLMNFSRSMDEDYGNDIVDLNKEIKFILDIISHDFHNNNIAAELNLAETLPSIKGSINHLQQVFLNLLINARDAMPTGGTVTVTTEVKDFKAYIHFTDSGTGIAPENMPKLFNAFFTTKEAGKGTGLGLAICQKIISNHNGEIKVKSEIDKGTTFSIILPLKRVAV
jgi:signal transduction histidine kinase